MTGWFEVVNPRNARTDPKDMDAQIHAAFTGKLPETKQRRRVVRKAAGISAVLIPVTSLGSEAPRGLNRIPAQLRDWSGQGAGLRVRQPLDASTNYRIETESPLQLLPAEMLRVVACSRDADGWYRIGAVWCEPLPMILHAAA